MPWGRQVGASAKQLQYRARVCLEGVPVHAHNVDAVLHLLPKQSIVEGIDYARESEDEKGCFILWIWCNDPEAVAVQGTLKIEEPLELPEECYGAGGDSQMPLVRTDAMNMLQYDAIIHLDRFEDFSPPCVNSSNESFHSDISGLPSENYMSEWPARHSFVWHLGQLDVLPDLPRVSALARLGERRDRSPPRGGGAGGAGGGFHQAPPNHFHSPRPDFGEGTSLHRGSGGMGGGYFGYYKGNTGENLMEEGNRKAVSDRMVVDLGIEKHFNELSLCRGGNMPTIFDPMLEEIKQTKAQTVQKVVVEAIKIAQQGDQIIHDEVHAVNEEQENLPPNSVGFMQNVADEGLFTEEQGVEALQESRLPSGNEDNGGMGKKQREGKEHMIHKTAPRGIPRLAVPLKRSLLCNPSAKPKNSAMKKCSKHEIASLKESAGGKKYQALPIEIQASTLLMKASDIIKDKEEISDEAHDKFGEQFVEQMNASLVGNLREALGLPDVGGPDVLRALTVDADD
ncbi:unnamed protein product [Urochloa humidicola]